MTGSILTQVQETARQARLAASQMASGAKESRTAALLSMADELAKNASQILEANKKDCQRAEALVSEGKMQASFLKRLHLDEAKLGSVIEGIRQIAHMDDQLGKTTLKRELDDGLKLYRVICPIGVILVIFESRPDALPQIMSLLVKSGNAGLIKGGKEAENSNRIIFDCLEKALSKNGFPKGAFNLLTGREEVADLLKLDNYVDLVIPRGSNDLVRHIQENTRIPVLGHAEGICHLYVDEKADLDMALKLSVDSKVQYPAACNAIETLLVHRKVAGVFLSQVIAALKEKNVEVRVDKSAIESFKLKDVGTADDTDWASEYSDLTISLKVVDSLDEAIDHINTYGSGHTDCIVTDDEKTFDRFFAEVNSAGVYCNASTRFADGFRYGFGAEVGISTGKLHPRGPVGVEGIVTYKYKLIGSGQTVAEYSGDNARCFTHRDCQ
ncbi:MAG: glutamate-5-semialdehyde dehydrogenase [Candidatus Melainabacteria bacterium]|jgi:glutamate-5-semialdehyde dehydrogenase|nr:glutamate-5-semialdehyde dehydrogenase [Candidatus Melainabacteria bacterium]